MRKWSRHNKIVQRSVLSPGHLPWAGTTIWLEALQRHHEVTAVSPPETGPRPAQLGVPPASPAFAQKIRLVSQGQGGCFIFKVPPPRPHVALAETSPDTGRERCHILRPFLLRDSRGPEWILESLSSGFNIDHAPKQTWGNRKQPAGVFHRWAHLRVLPSHGSR